MSVEVAPPPYLSNSSSDAINLRNLPDDHVKVISTFDPVTVQPEPNITHEPEEMEVLVDTKNLMLDRKKPKTPSVFEEISDLLNSFDSMGLRDTWNNAMEALCPGWETLRRVSVITHSSFIAYSSLTKTYNDMPNESHKDAVEIKAFCDSECQRLRSFACDV